MAILACAVLASLAYAPAQFLPFISDDYLQIHLARQYITPSGLIGLAEDALYRCRATSLVLTRLTEMAFGVHPATFRLTALGVHILNCLLVMALGVWGPIGYRISYVAAILFAFLECHHEAVIWYAALPELLVMTFSLLCLLFWIRWMQSDAAPAPVRLYVASFLSFLLALLSKESAVCVTGLLALCVILEPGRTRRHWLAIMPFAATSVLYFASIYVARQSHLHFSDGTFSLSAPFWYTLANSSARMFWPWGIAAVAVLALLRKWEARFAVLIAGWILVTLLPYSFLTYMNRVPSRHKLLASVALALVLAAAFIAVWRFALSRRPVYRYAVVAALVVCVVHNVGYLWTKKQRQFRQRTVVTQDLLKLVRSSSGPIQLDCFPHHPSLAYLTVLIEYPGQESRIKISSPQSCDPAAEPESETASKDDAARRTANPPDRTQP